MTKLKLSAIPDDRPVKLTVELPGAVHRDLIAYSEVFAQEHGQQVEPVKLVPSMLTRFMSADRAFVRARRAKRSMRAEPWTDITGYHLDASRLAPFAKLHPCLSAESRRAHN
jgi:hypothetical protein